MIQRRRSADSAIDRGFIYAAAFDTAARSVLASAYLPRRHVGFWDSQKEIPLSMLPSYQQSDQVPVATTELERAFARSVHIFVNVRDRREPLIKLLDWLKKAGHNNVILINVASSYPPLLEFLDACPYRVVNLKRNLGPSALWMLPDFKEVIRNKWFVYTDSDVVPTDACPLDAVAYLYRLLQAFPNYLKAGLGLHLNDIPDQYRHKQKVIDWESGLYGRELVPGVFQADVDSTFALYRPHAPRFCPAMRTRGQYEARHTPWYIDSTNPHEEEIYYHAHARPVERHWRLDNGDGGRPSVPPVPGGMASEFESDPRSLLARLLNSKSGRLMLACRRIRRLVSKPTKLWHARECATVAEAQLAILEILRSDDWQGTMNVASSLQLLKDGRLQLFQKRR
jgi:hypothetical protein